MGCIGVLLLTALGCLDIYLDGRSLGLESPFSPEAVAERFEIIAPSLAVLVALVILSAIAQCVYGRDIPRTKLPFRSCKNMGETGLKRVGALRGGLLLAAVVFILLGVMNSGARDVLYKAIAICTECIGLG